MFKSYKSTSCFEPLITQLRSENGKTNLAYKSWSQNSRASKPGVNILFDECAKLWEKMSKSAVKSDNKCTQLGMPDQNKRLI